MLYRNTKGYINSEMCLSETKHSIKIQENAIINKVFAMLYKISDRLMKAVQIPLTLRKKLTKLRLFLRISGTGYVNNTEVFHCKSTRKNTTQ